MKNTLLTAASLAILTSFSQAALVDGLVNYWTFDGDAIDHAHGASGSASTVADNGSFGGGQRHRRHQLCSWSQGGLRSPSTEQQTLPRTTVHVIIPRSGDTLYGATTAHTPNTLTTSLWVTIGGDDTGWQTALSHGEGSQYRVAMRGNSNVPGYAGGSGEGPDNGPDITGGGWHSIIAISDGLAGETPPVCRWPSDKHRRRTQYRPTLGEVAPWISSSARTRTPVPRPPSGLATSTMSPNGIVS